eukprot:42511_1
MGFCFYWNYMYGYVLTKEHFQQILHLIHHNNLVTENNQAKYEFTYSETDKSFRLDCYETFSVAIGNREKYNGCKTNRMKYSYIIKRILLIMKQIIGDYFEISDDGWNEVENEIDIIQELKLDSTKIFTENPTPSSIQNMNTKNILCVSGFVRNIEILSIQSVSNLITTYYNGINIEKDVRFEGGEVLNVQKSGCCLTINKHVVISTDYWEIRFDDSNPKGGCIIMIGDEIINNGTVSAESSGYFGWNSPGYATIKTIDNKSGSCGSYGTKGDGPCKIYGNDRLSELYHGSGSSMSTNRGGGTIVIKCERFVNNGIISCDGSILSSGGSILIIAKEFVNYGKVTAVGKSKKWFGRSGDGRIAIYTDSFKTNESAIIAPSCYRNSYGNGNELSLTLMTKWKRMCGSCEGNVAMKRCGACKHVYYCSKECQRNDWKTHKIYCQKLKSAKWI